ncbi:MAG: methyltransferase domain-containing protein [Opitutaceae bacterium]|nr:methyltransferase domain-containing protein [Opitutaceae bacterium]
MSSPFERLAKSASQRYRSAGVTAWQFARGKLLGDPVYRAVWEGPWIREGTVVDLGCGQGLMLSLFAAAREQSDLYPNHVARDQCRLIGIETRSHVASIAQNALGHHAVIVSGDARSVTIPRCRTLLLFDVLHMMNASDQEALLLQALAALEDLGVIIVREADANAGWRFRLVQWANRAKALLKGYSSRSFHFRSGAGWRSWLEGHGLKVESSPMYAGTPFGNHLFVARRKDISTGV